MNKTDHIKTIRVYREPMQLELPFPPPVASEDDEYQLIELLCIIEDYAPELAKQHERTIYNWLEILDPLPVVS
jgi:hypothetical protein